MQSYYNIPGPFRAYRTEALEVARTEKERFIAAPMSQRLKMYYSSAANYIAAMERAKFSGIPINIIDPAVRRTLVMFDELISPDAQSDETSEPD